MAKYIWVEAHQEIKYSVGLEIGVDISQEEADILLELNGEDYSEGQDEYEILTNYLSESFVYGWGDFENVETYITEE